MGTKSYLGYREGNNVIWVECLHDGYPTGVGKVLLKYYSDDERARWLCETGNELDCTINSIYDHEYDFYKGRFFKMFDTYITPASSEGRGRDHGIMDVKKYKQVSPYAYLFEKGRWLVKGYSKDTNGYKPSDWAPLEEVLSQGVVESRSRRGRMLKESYGFDWEHGNFDVYDLIKFLEKRTGITFKKYNTTTDQNNEGAFERFFETTVPDVGDVTIIRYEDENDSVLEVYVDGTYVDGIDPTGDEDADPHFEEERNEFLERLVNLLQGKTF